jgi:hypothetical protein
MGSSFPWSILLIIAILVFFLLYFWLISEPPTETEEIEIEDCEFPKPKKKIASFSELSKRETCVSLREEIIQDKSVINYSDLKSIVFTKEFLEKYLASLKSSFRTKISKYSCKLRELREEIKSYKVKTSHDSNYDRLKKIVAEIETILSILRKRLKEVSIKTLSENFSEAISDPDKGLDSLVGRESVKNLLAVSIFSFARNPDLFFSNFQNIIITGSSGIGKSKLAETIGFVYSKSGILARNKVKCVTKQEFTSSYVNESATLTRKLLLATLEGVCFIDEAYDLAPNRSLIGVSIDHGSEAITELVNFLDKNIGLSIVIAAGYADEIENRFLPANQGLSRRFPHRINLREYSSRELSQICLRFISIASPNLQISKIDADFIYSLISQIYRSNKSIFEKQAGDMLNLSSYIVKYVYSCISETWKDGGNNEKMILGGFNLFLAEKGYSLS